MQLTKQEAINLLADIQKGKQIADDMREKIINLMHEIGPGHTDELGHKMADQLKTLQAREPACDQQSFELRFTLCLVNWALRVLFIEAFEPEVREAAR